MPFIRGRYHINPVMGEALEAAREAEAALLALEKEARQGRGANDDGSGADGVEKGPIHRVEIEAAEMVRPQSGHAERGFVARVHRRPAASDVNDSEDDDVLGAPQGPMSSRDKANRVSARGSQLHPQGPEAETHVFSNHGDLLNFLRDEMQKDCAK